MFFPLQSLFLWLFCPASNAHWCQKKSGTLSDMAEVEINGNGYCWWFRNPANQLRLVLYPIIYPRFIHARWLFRISEPSTVWTLPLPGKRIHGFCWFMRIVRLGDESKKKHPGWRKKETPKKNMAGSTYLWTFWKRIFVPTKYVLCDHSQTFPWVFLEDELNSMWIVNRTRGSCQRTFMSYSRLISLSFRNKHKVKRKPSWDKSGNKPFCDPPRPSPARKKNQTPPGNHDIDFYPNFRAKMYPTLSPLFC